MSEKGRTSGVYPQAKPEDKYQGVPVSTTVASGSNPFPPASRPAVADPSALPSNIKQREEVRAREDKEWAERHPEVYGGKTDIRQQPGAPSQQFDREVEATYPTLTEQTKREQEAGRKAVEAAEQSAKEARDRGEEAIRRAVTEAGETGEQAEAKRLEAIRQRETWGEPPGVTRETIAGARGETPPPATTPPPPPPAKPAA